MNKNRRLADKLHKEGQALSDKGDDDGALAKYKEALALDPDRAHTHYNIGLIYKYRRDWRESFASNKRAVELASDDEAANWNLAIAATALREWRVARDVWQSLGIAVKPGDGALDEDFGATPVRLNPDGDAEVVWARRVCPVRARVTNIPLPESGFRFGDVVLHDGAAVGYRRDEHGKECPVFNVFELFERSRFATFELRVIAQSEADVEALFASAEEAEVECEDWTRSVRTLCKACSEGRPHEQHDHSPASAQWVAQRRIAMATLDAAKVRDLVKRWSTPSRRAEEITPVLNT